MLADTPELMDAVYQLRYACYHRKGAIPTSDSQRFLDHYDELPNHRSFLVKDEQNQAVATVRISIVRPDLGRTAAPSRTVFGDHPAFARFAGDSYVEASRLCFGEQARRDAFYRLVANMAVMAGFYDARWLVACPREEHSGIYQRLFGFKPLAEPRQYFGVNFRTELLGLALEDLKREAERVRAIKSAWMDAQAIVATINLSY
jgi:hypothetical protein